MKTKHARNDKHFNSTKRINIKRRIRAIYHWYRNTRSSPADVKQHQCLRVYHRKIQNFSNYLPFGNDANFGNYPDAADVIINRSRKITSSIYNIFATFPCLAQHPSAFTSRCPTDKEGRGASEPPPEDFYVFRSFKPCRRQGKTNKRSSPADASRKN